MSFIYSFIDCIIFMMNNYDLYLKLKINRYLIMINHIHLIFNYFYHYLHYFEL
jgi:hypothetical protein